MAAPANRSAALEELSGAVTPTPALPRGDTDVIVSSLPLESQCAGLQLCPYNGFWLPEHFLTIIKTIHARFKPRPADIILASYPKSGTTWLKALAFAALHRATYSPFDKEHPLRRSNPHDCVSFIDMNLFDKSDVDINDILEGFEASRSPRLLATHLPYSLMPPDMAEEVPGCRIVYICRNPKDVLVSDWFFVRRLPLRISFGANLCTLQEVFEQFCEGRSFCGPYWQHILQYWEKSSRSPDKVLLLRYEEMLRDPISNLKKLAEFMGCGFSKEEEEGGVMDAIVELCSLKALKNLDVNKHGYNKFAAKNEVFFRKGEIGDWRNHLTPDMAERMDKIMESALEGSGFTFNDYN